METSTLTFRHDAPLADLVRRCLLGRRDDDWCELLERHGRHLRYLARKALSRQRAFDDDVDDVLQELYLRLLARDRSTFLGRSDFELWGYMAKVAHSVVADRRRRAWAGKRGGRRRERGRERVGRVHDPLPSPEHAAAARQELGRFLWRCRTACGPDPELEMRVFRLAFFEGMTSTEIARTLRPRLTAVKVDQVVNRLRRNLARHGIGLGRRRRAA